MDNLDLKKRREEKEVENNRICAQIYNMKVQLREIKRHAGRSTAFRLLNDALDNFEQQVDRDHSRWVSRFNARQSREEVSDLQKSLNRERKLREEMQSKIKEASESSGLFISYVRSKLKI